METTGEEQTTEPTFRFSIRMLLWLITIIAVGLGVFGPIRALFILQVGIWPACYLSVFRKKINVFEWFLLLGVGLFLYSILSFPPESYFTKESLQIDLRSTESASRIESLGSYILKAKHLPTNVYDKSNNALHSWRGKLATSLREEPFVEQLDFSKPWNDPKSNLALYENGYHYSYVGSQRKRPMDTLLESTFFAVIDEEAAWKLNEKCNVSSINDDPANTILLIEVMNSSHPWYEPYDLTIDKAIDLLTEHTNERYPCDRVTDLFFVSQIIRIPVQIPHVLTADGIARQLETFPSRKLARAALTANGGEQIDLSTIEFDPFSYKESITVYHWDKILGTLAFAVLGIAPLFFKNKEREAV